MGPGFNLLLKGGYVKGAREEPSSEHELLAQCARVESLGKELSSLTGKVTHSLAQNDPKYFKDKNNCLASKEMAKWTFLQNSCIYMHKSIFCASMMKISLEIESNGFKFSSRDIFMGNRLEKVLTWQKPKEGCFGEPSKGFEHTSGVADQKQLLRRGKRKEKLFGSYLPLYHIIYRIKCLKIRRQLTELIIGLVQAEHT
ncbi:UPF0764 protein C16orf89 homolog [Accipiter gentilis]|uniref:UPF0764 protein C16orf89 homolog n=1 Tax=Astur gentilis TaxID=8957 RepID=UPI002110DC04|nr:UPF0764 protein C16orf89 homolog [Accipiter gentilis]